MKDSKEKFSRITISLHWIVGLTIICLLAVGKYMEINEVYALYPTHKSIGILVLVFVLARVIWRLINGWPTPVSNYKKLEHILAKTIHWILIIGTLLMPISGMLMSYAGGHGLQVFGLELAASNPDINNPGKMMPINKDLAGLAHETHEIVGNIIILAVLLHITGALKHHFIDKDGTLRRMLGAKI